MSKFTVLFTALALALLALLVFVFGNGGETTEGEQEVFLTSGKLLSVQTESIEDTTAFLGERFVLRFTIQYRADKIEPNVDSLATVPLDPFNIAGSAKVQKRELENNISEYIYEIPLRRITTIPGKSYFLNPILLKYEYLETGVEDVVDISPQHAFQTGSYYGRDLEGVALRPPQGAVKTNLSKNSIMLLGLSLASLIAIIFVLFRYKNSPEPTKDTEGVDEVAEAVLELDRFYNEDWVMEKAPRERLKQVANPALKLAKILHGISPHMFWKKKDSDDWTTLTTSLSSAYKRDLEGYEDVFAARDTIHRIFSDTVKKKRTLLGARKRLKTRGR